MARDTVIGEKPHSRATSAMVVMLRSGRGDFCLMAMSWLLLFPLLVLWHVFDGFAIFLESKNTQIDDVVMPFYDSAIIISRF